MTDVYIHVYGDSGPYGVYSKVAHPSRARGAGLGSSVHRVPTDLWQDFTDTQDRYEELQDAIDACPLWNDTE